MASYLVHILTLFNHTLYHPQIRGIQYASFSLLCFFFHLYSAWDFSPWLRTWSSTVTTPRESAFLYLEIFL